MSRGDKRNHEACNMGRIIRMGVPWNKKKRCGVKGVMIPTVQGEREGGSVLHGGIGSCVCESKWHPILGEGESEFAWGER